MRSATFELYAGQRQRQPKTGDRQRGPPVDAGVDNAPNDGIDIEAASVRVRATTELMCREHLLYSTTRSIDTAPDPAASIGSGHRLDQRCQLSLGQGHARMVRLDHHRTRERRADRGREREVTRYA